LSFDLDDAAFAQNEAMDPFAHRLVRPLIVEPWRWFEIVVLKCCRWYHLWKVEFLGGLLSPAAARLSGTSWGLAGMTIIYVMQLKAIWCHGSFLPTERSYELLQQLVAESLAKRLENIVKKKNFSALGEWPHMNHQSFSHQLMLH